MGFLGLLKFFLKCIDVLAWPSFALCYPLCASVRAIETNSNYHMRKLITYWILFSLISLFEHAFVKLIEWVPLWPYVKMVAICGLVVPRFTGAYYAYKHLVHPCFSVNFLVVIKSWLNKPRDVSFKTETFLALAERYVRENGTEALEKLIASRPKGGESKLEVVDEKEMKAVATMKKKEEVTTSESSKLEVVDQKEIKAVATMKKKEEVTTSEPKDIRAVEVNATNKAAATSRYLVLLSRRHQLKHAHGDLAANLNVPVADGKNEAPEAADSKKVQREWTCAVCQVKTTCERNLNSHLVGKKHRAKCEELKSSKQMAKDKTSVDPAAQSLGQSIIMRKYISASIGPREDHPNSMVYEIHKTSK